MSTECQQNSTCGPAAFWYYDGCKTDYTKKASRMELHFYPDPILHQKARPVAQVDDAIVKLTGDMLELMRERRGIGLAGPQVGEGLRLFVMNLGGDAPVDRVLINPEILDTEGMALGEEGCLSFPRLYAKIARPTWIRYRALNVQGAVEEKEAEGIEARVILHETDHLDGVLFLKRMSPAEKQSLSRSLRDLEQEYEESHPGHAKGRARTRSRR